MNLAERASRARAIVGTLASEGRGPKMSIPVRDEDEDVFLCDTLHGLEAEVGRLTADLAAARAERDNYQQAMKDAVKVSLDLTAERDGLAKALRDLLDGMGMMLDDSRLAYVEVQIDRVDLDDARAAVASLLPKGD